MLKSLLAVALGSMPRTAAHKNQLFTFYHILVIDNLFMTLEVPFTTIAHNQYYIIYFMGRLPSEL